MLTLNFSGSGEPWHEGEADSYFVCRNGHTPHHGPVPPKCQINTATLSWCMFYEPSRLLLFLSFHLFSSSRFLVLSSYLFSQSLILSFNKCSFLSLSFSPSTHGGEEESV
jgi:hypothetical protein